MEQFKGGNSMNKIVGLVSQYFGHKDLEDYQILSRNGKQAFGLDLTIASMAVFHDTLSRPRSIDLRRI
jgi:hypothetical protein